jgi:HAE1 family hydrophobic/amphiphilic exporter-1
VVVLFPIVIMKSMVGFFFAPFALSMVIMTLASLFIFFTLTPILCAKFLKPAASDGRGLLLRVERLWNGMLDAVTEGFIALLRYFAGSRIAAAAFMAFCVFMLWHSLTLAGGLGFDFFPDSDRGKVSVKLEYPTGYSLGQTTLRVQEVKARLEGLTGLKHVVTTIGKVEGSLGQSNEGVYLAQVTLVFPQRTERPETITQLEEQIRGRLSGYADAIVTVSTPSTVGGQSARIEVEIAGEDLAVLDDLAVRLEKTLRERPGFLDSDSSVRLGKPELRVTPKREVLSDLGMPALGVGMVLRANLEGMTSAVYKKDGRNYDIVVKLAEEEGKEQVGQFLLPGPPGNPLLLSTVGEVSEGLAPIRILRKNKMRISKIFANNELEKPLGTAVEEIRTLLSTDIPLPAGYRVYFPGQYEVMQEGNAAFAEAGIIAIILVYLVLAAILESFLRPFIILLTLPLGFVGVVWALWFTGMAFSMMVMLGIVMLIGIVVNNAILIMDSVEQYRGKGVSSHEAMILACRDQFRPIIMITAAAILGMLPLAMDQGIGSEPRVALGVASVGGIAISAVLTLLVIPIIYDFFTRRKKHGAGTGPDVTPPAAEPGPEAPAPAPSE